MEQKVFTIALIGPHDPINHSLHELESARVIGSHLARLGAVVATPALPGFPMWGALGAREVGGTTIGFSPAGNKYEHEHHFRLPLDYLSSVIYTGFGHLGRDVIMARSVDAVVVFLQGELFSHQVFLSKELQKPIIVYRLTQDDEEAGAMLGESLEHAEIYDTQEEVIKRLKQLITE